MQTKFGRIDSSRKAWRAKEVLRGLFLRRGAHGYSGYGRAIKDVVVTLLFGHFLCAVFAPATVLLLTLVKEDFAGAGPRVLTDPALLLGGWSAVLEITQPGIETVSLILFAFSLCAFVVFTFYLLVVQPSQEQKTILGMPKGVRGGEYGDGGVESSQVVLAQIHRTWDPRCPLEHAGLPLGYSMLLHRYYLSGTENHTVSIAPPGVGKTQRYILQMIYMLIKAEKDSAVIFDPKCELYELTGQFARESGCNVVLWDFDKWKRSDLYNCLSEIHSVFMSNWNSYRELVRRAANAVLAGDDKLSKELSKRAEMARVEAYTASDAMAGSLAFALIPETIKTDSYWTPSARNFFHAVVGALATYTKDQWVGKGVAPEEPDIAQRTLKTVAYLIDQKTKWNRNTNSMPLTDFMDGLGAENPFSKKYSQIRNAEGANLTSLISSLNKYLGETSSPANDMIGYGMPKGYENLEAIGEKKTIVYICTSTESDSKKVMLPIITKQIYDALIRASAKHGGELPYHTHFLMEELGSMSLIGSFEEFLRTGRGYGIRIHAVLQSENQWASMYGQEHAQTIKESINCTNYIKISQAQDAEALSREIGDTTITVRASSARAGILRSCDVSTTTRHEKIRAVPANKIKEWNSEWGNFVRIDKLYANRPLNKLLFHRKTARIAIFPTTASRFMPASCEMGIETKEKGQAVRARAAAEDCSALRREIPSWDFNQTKEEFEEITSALSDAQAVGLSTSRDIDKAVEVAAEKNMSARLRAWAYAAGAQAARDVLLNFGPLKTDEDVKRAAERAEKTRKMSISKANHLVATMIAALPFALPPQEKDAEKEYLRRRQVAQSIWRSGLYDTLKFSRTNKTDRKGDESEQGKEKPAQTKQRGC